VKTFKAGQLAFFMSICDYSLVDIFAHKIIKNFQYHKIFIDIFLKYLTSKIIKQLIFRPLRLQNKSKDLT